MTQKNVDSVNVFEQISQICRDFRKQISQGRSPRIEKYLSAVSNDGRETLFSNLLEIEINFRRSKGQNPTSEEYLKRFSQFAKQVRRAFFEPTMASVDSGENGDGATRSLKDAFDASEYTLTFQIPDANRLGDYELMRELGRGGMGVVYEARHTKTNNRVALKTLPTGGQGQEVNAEKLYRFRREFRRLSEINHPNLVGMQTLEVEGSQWFFTMDLIDGEDFLSYVRPNGELNEERLRSCIEQLARGVIALHRERIVHRDLKPSNVLVSADGRVSILDFGLAAEMQRTTDMTQTKSGMFAGTPRYAAPEQMFGERTEASDWYAFGTMLYEALSGEPPFTGKDQFQLLRDKQSLEAPLLKGRPGISEDLATIADGLIRREPTARMNSESIANLLQLNLDTRTGGSTAGSQGSSGSVSGEELDLENFEEEEIVLIGRDEQLAELESIKNEFLRTRKPQVVWITGLSGEGKSSLVHKFLRPIHKGDEMLVLSGRCYDRESVPFKVIDSFIDPLVRFLRSKSNDELETYLPEDIVALARLFPVLRRIDAISNRDTRRIAGLDDKQVHNLAFVALKELLFNISQRFPILIFVDDLQWGDADSATAIFRQLESEVPPRVLMLGSYRRDEMNESLFWKIWEKQSESHASSLPHHRIEVQPLSPEQAVELLAVRSGLSPDEVKKQAGELIDNAHGNPYFLEQLIEGFDPKTNSFNAVSLNKIISTKLKRLPADAAVLLDAIAVAGKAVSMNEASRVCGIDSAAFGVLAHMRSERLVRIIGFGEHKVVDTYHDKVRETVLESVCPENRRQLHAKFAELLESLFKGNVEGEDDWSLTRDKRLFDLAYHLTEAHDERAFEYQLKAGVASLQTEAPDVALAHLRKARALQPSNVSKSNLYTLRFSLGKCYAASNLLDDARIEFSESLLFAQSQRERAACHFELGEGNWKRSQFHEAIEEFRLGLAVYGERLPRSMLGKIAATISSLIGFHCLWFLPGLKLRKRTDEDLSHLARMYARVSWIIPHIDILMIFPLVVRSCILARRSRDSVVRSESYANYSTFLAFVGIRWLAQRMLRAAVGSNEELARNGFLEYCRGTTMYFLGRLGDAKKCFVNADKELKRVGDYRRLMVLHFSWHLHAVRGEFQHAVTL